VVKCFLWDELSKMETTMTNTDELKTIMLNIGLDSELVAAIKPAEPLALQGLDSFDFPAFAVAVEEKFGKKISDRDALRLKTLNDFAAFINGEL